MGKGAFQVCKREPSNVLAERNLNHGDEVQHHHSFLCVRQNACSNEKGLYGIETTCRMVNEKRWMHVQ